MAVILNQPMSGKRCFGCGIELKNNEPAVVFSGFRDVVYLHTNCAKSIGQQLMRDVVELVDLGFDDDID